MAEAPEIPEATTPFDKRVALTIAILAVMLSFVENHGDNAKTDAIIRTNEAANQWGYYQAKSIKGQLAEMQGSLTKLSDGATLAEPVVAEIARLASEAERYDSEKGGIKVAAEALVAEATQKSAVNDRCDLAALLLQIAVVVCSVAILSGWKAFWIVGSGLGLLGAVAGVSAFLM